MRMRLFLVVALAASVTYAEPFRDGDRVVFLGDSLTQGGSYHRIVSDYYLTRFPERNIRFFMEFLLDRNLVEMEVRDGVIYYSRVPNG